MKRKRYENLAKPKILSGNKHFDRLVEIVCDVYGVESYYVLGGSSLREYTAPRNVISTIWSRADTMHGTARLIGWKSHQQVFWARQRCLVMAEDATHKARLQAILERVSQELPWLLADDEEPDAAGISGQPALESQNEALEGGIR